MNPETGNDYGFTPAGKNNPAPDAGDKNYIDSKIPYKSYVALITQTAGPAVTSSILQNSLDGTPVWSHPGTGHYRLTLAGAFPDFDKIWYNYPPAIDSAGIITNVEWVNANAIDLWTHDLTGTESDAMLNKTPFEIRVYP